MAKDDLAQLEGAITDILGGGLYNVKLANGTLIKAKISGKMKQNHISVVVGDKVTIGVSPYDLSHGLILFRHKTENQNSNNPNSPNFTGGGSKS